MGARRPKVFLTYAWADNEGQDFDFLTQELDRHGVEAVFDRVSLVGGRYLWDQISQHITTGEYDGWAWLVTESSLKSTKCKEELWLALGRALDAKGKDFPLIGLIHQVEMKEVPATLRSRLCYHLSDPDWPEKVKSALKGQPPGIPPPTASRYVWAVHAAFAGNPGWVAVEVRPRFGGLALWEFVVPPGHSAVEWCSGPTGGLPSPAQTNRYDGGRRLADGRIANSYGGSGPLGSGVSAFIVFEKSRMPPWLEFGSASRPGGELSDVEQVTLPPPGA